MDPETATGPRGALECVTAVEMTPEDFPGELGETYPQACAALGVPEREEGYGLSLDQDKTGARWTRLTTDPQAVRSARALWHSEIQFGYEPEETDVRRVGRRRLAGPVRSRARRSPRAARPTWGSARHRAVEASSRAAGDGRPDSAGVGGHRASERF